MSVIKKPLITEKLNYLAEKGLRQYGFVVELKADKLTIRKDIEELYEVKVQSLRTMIVRGKRRNRFSKGGIITGKSGNYKKAIITLIEGHEIDFHKNI